MVNLITEHIDIWTAAQIQKTNGGRGRGKNSNGQSPHGIKKLRELILELALRGKLVPQDPNDEPARILLEKITKEKERLIKDGKIKKQKPLPKICEDEKPFELPAGWDWFRVGEVFDFQYGKALPAKSRDGSGDVDVYGSNGIVGKHTESLIDEPCIVIGRKGSAGALNMARRPSWTTDVAYYLIPPIGIYFTYAFIILEALRLDKLGKGIKPGINRNEAYILVGALPPLPEQQRIVAKVDELMALCDQLEQQQTDSDFIHQTLVETLLATLTNAVDQAELSEAWQRIATNFNTLFTTEQSIDQLKQTILQLSVMGKLVPQDPKDKPASVLLEKIAKEKARLVKEGKIKNQKPLPEIIENEKPFEIPSGWEWARPDDFSQKITDGEHFRPPTQDKGVYFLSAKDIRSDGVSLDDPLFISKETAEKALQRCNPEIGDILIVSRGATVGRMCTVDIEDVFCLLGSVILIKPLRPMLSEYLKFVMKTPQAFDQLLSASGSTAQPAIYLRDIKKIVFPIAPLAEQHRLVAKVDELMALCDTLKARLNNAQTTQVQLADVIVEQAGLKLN